MKRFLSNTCAVALTVAFVVPALAQDNRPRAGTSDRIVASQLDSVTQGANIRASKLTGMNIQNAQGKSVGEINDLVIDANSGKINYAAVTYGGFLGIGNKMFAVPFEAFKLQRAPNDADEIVLILNVTQQQMEGAVGFDEDHWPDFADQKFTTELYKRYGVERRMNRGLRDGGASIDIDRNGVEIDVKRNDN